MRCAAVLVLLLAPAGGQDDPQALARGLPHFRAANRHVQKGEYAAAVAELDAALPHLRRAGDASILAVVHTLRGFCLDRLGRHARALADHEAALEMLERVPGADTEQKALALNQQAVCLMRLGRGDEALARFERALAMQARLAAGADGQGHAKALNDGALCLLALGRPAEALERARASVAINRRLHPRGHAALAGSLDNLASCLADLGRHPEALAVREEVVALTRRLFDGDREPVAQALANFGYTLQHLGRAAEALPYFEEARAILGRVHDGDHPEVATALNNLAGCLHALGRGDEALALERASLAMLRRVFAGDHPRTALLLHNVAASEREAGRPEDALASYDAALAMRRRLFPGGHPDVARSMHDRANCLRELGRPDEAERVHKEALAMARRVQSPLVHVHASSLADLLLDDRGRAEEAVPLLEEAIARIEEHRRGAMGLTEEDRAAYVASLTRSRAFDGMVRAQLALGRPHEALAYLERGRARSLLDLLERSRFDPLAEVRRQARGDRARLDELDALETALRDAESEAGLAAHALAAARRRTDLKRAEQRGLIVRLRTRRAQSEARRRAALRARARLIRSRLDEVRPADTNTIRAMLAPGERLCAYSLDDRGGQLFVVGPTSVRAYALDLDAARAAALVDAYRARILAREDGSDLARGLFDALMPPRAWAEIRKARRVVVVPHVALHRLPFEALVVAEKEYWLDGGPPIAYAASGSAALWSRGVRDRQRRADPPARAVALGDPVFRRGPAKAGRPRHGELARLPGTRREVDAVRETLAPLPVRTLLGEEATESRLFAAAPGARYLHIATHQVAASASRAEYTSLALTAPAAPTPEDDGHLRLIDLFERWRGRLDRCELVVLSACETRLGRELEDEGVFAMPWGFLYAGAPCVLASLWRVDDASTANLFADFYRRLGTGGDTLAAFTAARRALRRTRTEPYFWAPFVCIGSTR